MARKKKQAAPPALNITLPKGWGELTPAQVSRVAYYLSLNLDETEFLVKIGCEFADLKPRGAIVMADGGIAYRYYHRDRGNVLIDAEQVAAIAEALRWIVGEPESMTAPELDGYPTPDSRLYNITLEQYITADTACNAYIRMQNNDALRVMAAALYPLSSVFDSDKLGNEAKRLTFLPHWQLQAVLLWYIGTKKMLMQKYPLVFAGGDSDGGSTPGAEVLLGLLSSLNEGRVVDNDKLKQTGIHEVFYELNLKIRNAQKSQK